MKFVEPLPDGYSLLAGPHARPFVKSPKDGFEPRAARDLLNHPLMPKWAMHLQGVIDRRGDKIKGPDRVTISIAWELWMRGASPTVRRIRVR